MFIELQNIEMPLRKLTDAFGIRSDKDFSEKLVRGLTSDSREVIPGTLFFAIVGNKFDGHDYIKEALSKGAVAAVVQKPLEPIDRIILVDDTRAALAQAAKIFYSKPDEYLDLLGITGTNGKTTSTYMVGSIMDTANDSYAIMGTLGCKFGSEYRELSFTNPEPVKLYRLLAEIVNNDFSGVVMEVSSHGLIQQRNLGLKYSVAGFTNLTQDHLDYHGDMETYFRAKASLFESMQPDSTTVLNWEDPYGKRLIEHTQSKRIIKFGFSDECEVRADNINYHPDGTDFKMITEKGSIDVNLQISGDFNVENALCAASIGIAQGISLNIIARGLESFGGVCGRLERIKGKQDFSIFIDYSHTPDALKNAINACSTFTKKRVIVIFGAGGDRDRTKRPLMGKVAGNGADLIIITNDNPRTEDPESILDQIQAGIPTNRNYKRISNREEAIRYALETARSGDVVLIAGKGHEDYQILGDQKRHFSDHEVARKWLEENNLGN